MRAILKLDSTPQSNYVNFIHHILLSNINYGWLKSRRDRFFIGEPSQQGLSGEYISPFRLQVKTDLPLVNWYL